MIEVLFIQGGGEGVHAQWDDKLVVSLRRELGVDYDVRYPLMPNEADPTWAAWRPVIEREIAALNDSAIIVGHSVGGTLAIHVLANHAPRAALGAIVLIAAPFIGASGWPSDEIAPRPDLGARLPESAPVLLYHGESDTTVPVAHVELYASAIPQARVRRLPGRDHQLGNDLSEVANDIRSLTSRTA